jgi:hypothetical protein
MRENHKGEKGEEDTCVHMRVSFSPSVPSRLVLLMCTLSLYKALAMARDRQSAAGTNTSAWRISPSAFFFGDSA